jgi:ankyrin repeat/protein kinase domain-containing protein 1
VSQEPRLLELIDHLGFTPLHVAAYRGNVEMGELLLKLGANPVCSDNNGRWPFYIALASGHHAFAKMLMKKSAAGTGWLPVHTASIGGVQAHLESFSADEIKTTHAVSKLTPLHLAASSDSVGSAEAVLHLIENGADVNAVDVMGKTALFFAASCGALQPLRVLLGKVFFKEKKWFFNV